VKSRILLKAWSPWVEDTRGPTRAWTLGRRLLCLSACCLLHFMPVARSVLLLVSATCLPALTSCSCCPRPLQRPGIFPRHPPRVIRPSQPDTSLINITTSRLLQFSARLPLLGFPSCPFDALIDGSSAQCAHCCVRSALTKSPTLIATAGRKLSARYKVHGSRLWVDSRTRRTPAAYA
jgi:hypothetical protein